MTVKELIEELSKHSENIRVVIKGYEDGVDDVGRLKVVKLKLDTGKEWYYGKHSVTEDNDNYSEFGLLIE
ncbi:MAG: hypothetical protein EBS19_10365 [Spirochaetia bacterium]|nr:hypothetical protein [Spirochaetia bacterium]